MGDSKRSITVLMQCLASKKKSSTINTSFSDDLSLSQKVNVYIRIFRDVNQDATDVNIHAQKTVARRFASVVMAFSLRSTAKGK